MMKQMLKRTGALLLSLCLTLSVWGVLTPLPAVAAVISGEYKYWIKDDNTATITKYLGSGGDVTIPDALDGHTVTEIGIGYHSFYGAFDGCTGLTSVIIPDSVITIGDHAFYCCTGLTSVTIGNNVTTIDDYSFCGCTGLTSVIIPNSVTKLGQYAFDGCIGLTSVTIGDSVTTIGFSAFEDCTGLTSIHIPDSVTKIVYYAFLNTGYYNDPANWENGVLYIDHHLIEAKADELPTVYSIRSGTKTIAHSAFSGCTGLTSVDIPDSMTTIGNLAFSSCTGLTSVTIPDSVTSIGSSAFHGCYNLTIYGKVGSYAETYAKANGIPFGTKVKNQETGIMVEGTAETLQDDAVLNAKQTASGEDTATYEITLTQNGHTVQPTGEVTVKIPLPESMKDKRIMVYRVEANGSRTNMNATVQSGYAVFVTDHFSQYVLEVSDALLGDIDGNGKVDVTDALAILRMAVGLTTPVDNADMDGSGGVTVTDALAALRIAVGLA